MASIPNITLASPVAVLPGIGSRQSELLAKLSIATVEDLIRYRPRRWDDFSQVVQIADLSPGRVILKAQILEAKGRYLGRRGLHLTEALACDETGAVRIVWFNQPYRARSLKINAWYYLTGLYDFKYRYLQLLNPSTELVEGEDPKLGLVRAVYPTTTGLKNAQLQHAILALKPHIGLLKESLPAWLLAKAGLPPLAESCFKLHFPKNLEETLLAESELNLRRLIALSISSQLLKAQRKTQKARPIAACKEPLEQVVAALDFELMPQQQTITAEILNELETSGTNLNRLIQGDVGAGKTLIAALVALSVVKSGFQVAFLAPTQILARQHFQTLKETFKIHLAAPELALLTADLKPAERRRLSQELADGRIRLIIGTHALLSESVKFQNLALIIIDEQHRFGVEQRLKLLQKADQGRANILTLSATPIPRSLALVLYADLDISLLKESPPNRLQVKTSIIALKERSRLQEILKKRSQQNQIYVVCPAIEDVEIEDSLAKTEVLIKNLVPNLKYGILHARLPAAKKEQIMNSFLQGSLEVLLATSIVGAGLDIPNANTIIIMSPERFGLAQLHQMRGRVGRSDSQGYCYLCPFSDQRPSGRLQALLASHDGFELSEIDLQIRGPGTLHGLRQSGLDSLLGQGLLKQAVIEQALTLAQEFIEKGEDLKRYPKLKEEIARHQMLTHLN